MIKEIIGFIVLVLIAACIKQVFSWFGINADGLICFYVVAIIYATTKEVYDKKIKPKQI